MRNCSVSPISSRSDPQKDADSANQKLKTNNTHLPLVQHFIYPLIGNWKQLQFRIRIKTEDISYMNDRLSHFYRFQTGILLAILFFITGCLQQSADTSVTEVLAEHPEWTRNAVVYEVNIRQYSGEGTFDAFREHLPRLKKMGVDILWLMPIHPIGEEKRKGELGSYYSVKDYTAVNPHFGTMDDFKELVQATHEQGMKLILDWVPNHTAWDHPWVSEHPEYYMKDSLGNITYEEDWFDIAQLNYENRELWDKMIENGKFWVTEAGIDGYRVDHAGHDIPLEFWKRAIPEINREKEDLFWLAEWNTPEMHPWFDATYTWEYFHLTTAVAKGEEPLSAIHKYMTERESQFPEHAYRLFFTTNHDENAWNGTDRELFGDNFENFAVMAATVGGMPLIYGGQETGLDKQLAFFEKDAIEWDDYEYEDFYRTLFELKKRNEALWNGQYGGRYEKVPAGNDEEIYAFRRIKDDFEVLVVLNMSAEEREVTLQEIENRSWRNVFTGASAVIGVEPFTLDAYGYLVFEKKGIPNENS